MSHKINVKSSDLFQIKEQNYVSPFHYLFFHIILITINIIIYGVTDIATLYIIYIMKSQRHKTIIYYRFDIGKSYLELTNFF